MAVAFRFAGTVGACVSEVVVEDLVVAETADENAETFPAASKAETL
jgi:purine-nucleoside phosphorylase